MRVQCLGRCLRTADLDAVARHVDPRAVVYTDDDSDADADTRRRVSVRCEPGL
jgi:hypothetical protein